MGNVVIATLRGVRSGELRTAATSAVAVLVVAFVVAGATGWAGPAAEAHRYDGAELRYDRQADGSSNVLADSTRVDTREGRRSVWFRPPSVLPGLARTRSPHLLPQAEQHRVWRMTSPITLCWVSRLGWRIRLPRSVAGI